MANEGFNLGTAYGSIVIDTAGIGLAMRDATRLMNDGFRNMGDNLRAFGDSLSNIGTGLSVLTQPLLSLGRTGLEAAADFDQLMNQISIFGGVTGEELEAVRQYALKMGADTKFSASDAAAAFLNLLKAGQDTTEATATLATVLDLAAAGNLNLEQASAIVTGSLAMFNLEVTDASRVSDALARAANASMADVGDLGQALTNVGPVAAMFGLSIEDTVATLGVFANSNIKGADAGTLLKSMLLNITRPTDDVKGAMDRLGVSFYDANGNAKDFDTFLGELDTALDQLPVEEQNEYMQLLGGTYGIVGLTALRAAGGIDTMRRDMDKAASAAQIAAAQNESFLGVVESLKGSVETLMIEALTPLMNEVLKPLAIELIRITNRITMWAQRNPQLTKTIGAVVAVAAGLGAAFLTAGMAISAIGSIISGVIGVITFMLSPIGLLIAAAVALGIAYQTNFLGIRDILQPIIENVVIGVETLIGVLGNMEHIMTRGGIPLAIAAIVNAFGQMFGLVENEEMADWALNFGNTVYNAFLSVVQFIQNTVLPVLSGIGTAISSGARNIVEFAATVGNALGGVATWVTTVLWPAIRDFFQPAVDKINELINAASSLMSGNLVGAWPLLELIRPFLPLVIQAKRLFDEFVEFVTVTALPSIQSALDDVDLNVIVEIGRMVLSLSNPFSTVTNLLRLLGVDIGGIVTAVIGGLATFFENINNGETLLASLQSGFSTAAQGIATAFGLSSDQSKEAGNVVSGAVQSIQSTLGGMGEFITNTVMPALDEMGRWFTQDALPVVVGFVRDTVAPAISGFIDRLADFWVDIQPGLNSFFQWVTADALPLVADTFTNVIQPAIDLFVDVLFGLWDTISPSLTTFFNWFTADGLPIITDAISAGQEIIGGIIDILAAIWDTVSPGLTQFGEWFSVELGFILTAVSDFYTNFLDPYIIQPLVNLYTSIAPGIEAFGAWFNAPEGGLSLIKAGIQSFLDDFLTPYIITPLQTLWDTISTGVTTFANWFNAPDGGLAQISISITLVKTFLTDNIITPLSNLWTSVSAGVEAFKNGLKSGFDWINANVITPIKTAIDGVIRVINDMVTKFNDAKNTITGGLGAYSDVGTNVGTVANAVTSGQVGIGDVLGALGNAISAEFSPRAIGGSVTANMPYLVGERGPELFTPSTSGNISTAGNTQKAMGGTNFSFPGMVIYANSYAEGQAAADGFMHQVEQKIAFAGVTPS